MTKPTPRCSSLLVALCTAALAFALVHAPLATPRARAQTLAPPSFRVVVNAGVPLAHLRRDFIAGAFLRKITRWAHGEPIRPVDQEGDSPVRRKFSSDVLQRTVPAVRSYWQQLIFTGRGLPPPELTSDHEVIRYVARNPGAIGYVSGGTDLAAVKVVSVD